MMFGDMGHGSILLAVALVLVLGADRFKDTLLAPVLGLRYIFMFMGISATYCGFIYNEFFAMQTDIFASCYHINKREQFGAEVAPDDGSGQLKLADTGGAYYYERLDKGCTYPMGTDPIWGISSNKLTVHNGIKMKLSVIFGVLHMTMGILHKGTNCVYFRDWPSLFTEVIAGIIILLGLFGWMDLLIIAKWLTPLDIDDRRESQDPRCKGKAAGLETNAPEEDLLGIPEGDC
jgi:V-type H+-transporting ATPase subunit a